MDTSKYIGYSSLLNQFEMNTDNITSNTINSTDINTTNINVSGTININGLVNNQFLFADLLGNVTSKNIVGTPNEIIVNNAADFTLSLARDVSFNNLGVSNNLYLSSLPSNIFLGTDSNKKLVSKSISGTINQVQINNDVCGNYIISGYQDLNTTSAPAFSGITVNGSIIANTLSTNSLLATDGTKTVINRSLSGTANQVNINTAGTTTTFSTPQDIGTSSNVVFNGMRAVDISGTNVTISGATAGRILLSDVNKKIVTSSYGESDMVLTSTNQIIGGNKTFSGTTNLSSLTASKIVLTDTSKNIVSSTLGVSDLVLTSTNQSIAGDKIMSGTNTYNGVSIFNNQISANGLFISGNAATFNNTATFNNPATFNNTATFGSTVKLSGLTASKILLTNGTKDIITSAYDITDCAILSATNDFTNTINFNGNVNVRSGFAFTNAVVNGTVNLSMLTAGQLLMLDSSQNITTTPIPANILGLNNTFTGTNTFTSPITLSSLTANKILLTDGSKNTVSSSYGANDLVLTSTNQTISGVKTYSNDFKLNAKHYLRHYAIYKAPHDTNQSISTTAFTKLDWLYFVWGDFNVNLSGSSDFSLYSPGTYLVVASRRISSFSGECDFFFGSSESGTTTYYGMQQMFPGQQYFTITAIIEIASAPATISMYAYSGNANLIMDDVSASGKATNRISIQLLNANGTYG